jgi:hypothetical protein
MAMYVKGLHYEKFENKSSLQWHSLLQKLAEVGDFAAIKNPYIRKDNLMVGDIV